MTVPTISREYRLPKPEGLGSFVLTEAKIPALKSNEVLVKVHAVSLQFRDLLIAHGQYPGTKDNVIPGSDIGGTIAAVGDAVQLWRLGDRVSANFAIDHIDGESTHEIKASALGAPIDGALKEYVVLPAHCLVKIPEHLSFEEASALPCAGVTAWSALYGPKPVKTGDHVLIIGTGGVSIFALQFAHAAGAIVIVLTSSLVKLEKAKSLGARHVINYKEVPDWEREVLKITDGRGVDHVIETGGAGTLLKSLASVRIAGNVSVIGIVAGGGDLPSHLPALVIDSGATLRGILVGSVAQFRAMNRAISAHQIRPVIDKVFKFEEFKEALEYLNSQKHVGKVVIKVARDETVVLAL